jgi:hypothetical protein
MISAEADILKVQEMVLEWYQRWCRYRCLWIGNPSSFAAVGLGVNRAPRASASFTCCGAAEERSHLEEQWVSRLLGLEVHNDRSEH